MGTRYRKKRKKGVCNGKREDVNVAELNGAPGPVESTVTIKGRQCAKLSGDP